MKDFQEHSYLSDSGNENEPQSQISAEFVPISNSEEDCSAMITRSSRRSNKSSPGRRKKQSRKPRKERHVIQHNYHDHAFDPVDFDDYVLDCDPNCALKKKGGVGTPFPLKLHELLEKAEEEGLNNIVSWQPHGRAFVVHKPKEFVTGIMHRFFRQTKLTSFQRQLNLYGFNRLTKGPDSGGYYHELFVRGRPYLTKRMIRTKIKGTGFKAASNPECEPDFYHMTPVDSPCPPPPMAASTPSDGTVLNDDDIPFVSPNEVSFNTHTDKQVPSLSDFFGTGSCDDSNVNSQGCHKPFLGKRINIKRVKMGNQSFQYMEHMEPLATVSSVNVSQSPDTTTTSEEQNAFAFSPTIFDSSFHDESCHSNVPKEVDPLSVFLAEIGTDFEDDINFGSTSNSNTFVEV